MQKLIESIFNIHAYQIEKLVTMTNDNGIIAHIRLKKDEIMYCPVCNTRLIGNGIKLKPINLVIDEIHSDMARRRDASYLCTLTDNDDFKLIDILTSRSKYELALFFEKCPKEERDAVKYVTIDMWELLKFVTTLIQLYGSHLSSHKINQDIF